MKKISKVFLSLALVLIVCLPMVFMTGCALSDLFGKKDIELNNGAYKITTYSLNGISQTEIVGSYCFVNDGTLTDWMGGVATYEITGKDIKMVWSGQATIELTGTVTKSSITLNSSNGGQSLIVVMTYIPDVQLRNGNYQITTYSVDGVVNSSVEGQICVVNNGTLTDWLSNVATYEIVGDSIKMVWSGQATIELTGTVTNSCISLDSTYGVHRYIMVITYIEE